MEKIRYINNDKVHRNSNEKYIKSFYGPFHRFFTSSFFSLLILFPVQTHIKRHIICGRSLLLFEYREVSQRRVNTPA